MHEIKQLPPGRMTPEQHRRELASLLLGPWHHYQI